MLCSGDFFVITIKKIFNNYRIVRVHFYHSSYLNNNRFKTSRILNNIHNVKFK
jgi:hypothetical protein